MDIHQKELSLFTKEVPQTKRPAIAGLIYKDDYICAETEKKLIDYIDQSPWLNDLKRRVQHYGYRYDYTLRRATKDLYLGPLPHWIDDIANSLWVDGHFQQKPDQVIVNEYLVGQGISKHIDCAPCFGDMIASLSLGSGAIMQFEKNGERKEMYLNPRSLVILSHDARYKWTHAIPARKSDTVDGIKYSRTRRLSLTFRTMKLIQK